MDPSLLPYFGLLDKDFIKKIETVCFTGPRIMMVTKSDEVFGFGKLPDYSLYQNIFELRPIHELDKKQVKKFVFGYTSDSKNYVLTLTEKGEVFSWGYNGHGNLGVGHTAQVDVPTIISALSEHGKIVIDVSCGRDHVMALCNDNSVYAWGRDFGNTPVLIQQSDMKIGITCSEYGSFYLKSNGEVYGKGYLFKSGSTSYYHLGNGPSSTNFPDWTKIQSLKNIVKIAAGKRHMITLNKDGTVFVWGCNDNQVSPVKLANIPERIIDIAANVNTDVSAVMDENDDIYVWSLMQGETSSNVMLTSFTSFNEVFIKLPNSSMSIEPITFDSPSTDQTISKGFKKGAFESIFDVQDDSDFTISVEGKNILVHKLILKMNNKYFHAMFTNQWKESDKKILKIDGFSYNSFRSFLSFLYTGEIDLTAENVFELMKIADLYSDETLLALIAKKVEDSSMPEDVIEIVKNITELSSSNYEAFCDGMRKFIGTPTSELTD